MKKISVNQIAIQASIRKFFVSIGENPDRDGLKETPKRFEQALKYLLGGYHRSLESENKIFDNLTSYKDIIILKNIDFFSICEHHLLPFYGYAHVGYIPGKSVLGISKLARAVEIYSRRLQDQETLGNQIAETILKNGNAKGVAVLLEGRHFCNIARGVEKKASIMSTLTFKGAFDKDDNLKNRFMQMIDIREQL